MVLQVKHYSAGRRNANLPLAASQTKTVARLVCPVFNRNLASSSLLLVVEDRDVDRLEVATGLVVGGGKLLVMRSVGADEVNKKNH